jgi:hypothetical protein
MSKIGNLQLPMLPFIYVSQATAPNKRINTKMELTISNLNGVKYDCFVSQKDGEIKTTYFEKRLDK